MNRKDFDLVAKALKDGRPKNGYPSNAEEQWCHCVNRIAAALEVGCAHFDWEKFMIRCGDVL
jgi:uncharacterized protein (DUF2237 family)